jgi:hypothetical protein
LIVPTAGIVAAAGVDAAQMGLRSPTVANAVTVSLSPRVQVSTSAAVRNPTPGPEQPVSAAMAARSRSGSSAA